MNEASGVAPNSIGTTNAGNDTRETHQGANTNPPAPGFHHFRQGDSWRCQLTREGARCNRYAPVIVKNGSWARRACCSCAATFYNRTRQAGVA